ncbi:transposase domain-containing protein [Tahibacter aquaticus]|uniref:transposase domain-containing protein n=1 Tax=Tahibacter aquaticus TaxID=520092 RepID=UPI00105E30CE
MCHAEARGQLGQLNDVRWIEQALSARSKASIRQRELPAQHAVWLLIGFQCIGSFQCGRRCSNSRRVWIPRACRRRAPACWPANVWAGNRWSHCSRARDQKPRTRFPNEKCQSASADWHCPAGRLFVADGVAIIRR